MPAGDRTGPFGQGPRTGRGAGYCAGFDAPGYANQGGFGFGVGRGRGRGRGGFGFRRNNWGAAAPGWQGGFAAPWYNAPAPTREEEMQSLKNQAEALQANLKDIERRIQEIDAAGSE